MKQLSLALPTWRVLDHTDTSGPLIFVGYPHTSRRDFFLTQLVRWRTGRRLLIPVIETEFSGPQGVLLPRLGGLSVPVVKQKGTVEKMMQALAADPSLSLALCPEGLIQRKTRWHTGFYVLALATDMPVSYVAFDYAQRTVHLSAPVLITGQLDLDLAHARRALEPSSGYRPEWAGPITFDSAWRLDLKRLEHQRQGWSAMAGRHPRGTRSIDLVE